MSNACFELYLGDCLEIMKTVPDASVDMIACDLPYGVTQNRLDVVIPFEPLWREYERVIKERGCIALFAQGVFFVELVQSNRKMFRYDLVWDKVLRPGFSMPAVCRSGSMSRLRFFIKRCRSIIRSLQRDNRFTERGLPIEKRNTRTTITVGFI